MTSRLAAFARLSAFVFAGAIILSACSGDSPPAELETPAGDGSSGVTIERLLNAARTPEEWLTYGGTYDEQRYARLSGVNKDNVADLGVAWTYDLATSRGVESTPIIHDGIMYVTGAWSIVYALDAKTGQSRLWRTDRTNRLHITGNDSR